MAVQDGRRMTGTVLSWGLKKGFGFIRGEDGQDYFVHITSMVGTRRPPYPGDEVVFDVRQSGRKCPEAINVEQKFKP